MAECGWPGGDVPGEQAFGFRPPIPVRRWLEEGLQERLGPLSEVDALADGPGVAGRYRVSAGGQLWFVRVSELWGQPDIETELLGFLKASGVPVNAPLAAGLRLRAGEAAFRVDIRPFLEGARAFNGGLEDLVALGRSLGLCHRALRDFPGRARIAELAAIRYAGFARWAGWVGEMAGSGKWQAFRELEGWAEEQKEWLLELSTGFSPRFGEVAGAQCVHGEIHRANVLYAGGRAVLLDFEESVHNHAVPDWDLAYLVQRFCLYDGPAREVLRERLAAVEAGYGCRLPDLRPMMRQLAWMAAVILVELCVQERQVKPAAEYAKFVKLERQARDLEW